MTVQPFAAGSYLTDRTTTNLVGLKSRLDTLSRQLATGRAAETYGGLGVGRSASLSAHATISALDGYTAAINGANTRVSLATASLTQVKTLGDSLNSSLLTDLRSTTASGAGQSVTLARTSLDAAVDALNQQSDGTYLFGGRLGDRPPVVSSAVMLGGDAAAGLDGLNTLIAQQSAADLGPAGNGRLTQAQTGANVSLTEDPSAEARANFGYSLVSATSSDATGVAANLMAGTPASVTLAFASQPADGDRVRVAVLQSDGSQKILDLTARSSVSPGETDAFAIGATPAETAANLTTLLGGAPVASAQSANPPGVSATFTGGSPAALSLSVGTPQAGQTVTLTLGLRDGTTQTITLTAAASADPDSRTSFAIGATPAETAANLSATLSNALGFAAQTGLTAHSTTRAAKDFFDGSSSPGLAPRRIAANGNGYVQTASSSTVIWYRGEDSPTDPRATAMVQAGANRSIAIGARANEEPLKAVLAGIAAMAASGFSDGTSNLDLARFRATADRVQTLVVPPEGTASVADIVGEFGVAAASLSDAKSQAQSTKSALQTSLDGIETVSTEQVAAELLTLQTQLQASYQVTASLSKLSLVNYIS